jgi:hypothetical protein
LGLWPFLPLQECPKAEDPTKAAIVYLGGLMTDDIYAKDYDLQKRIIRAKITRILNNKSAAEEWMRSPQYSLDGLTPNAQIDAGNYDKVLQEVGRLQTGCY